MPKELSVFELEGRGGLKQPLPSDSSVPPKISSQIGSGKICSYMKPNYWEKKEVKINLMLWNCYPLYLVLDGDCKVFSVFVKVGSSSSSLDRPDRLKNKTKKLHSKNSLEELLKNPKKIYSYLKTPRKCILTKFKSLTDTMIRLKSCACASKWTYAIRFL